MDIVYLIAYVSFISPLPALGLSLRMKQMSYNIRLVQVLVATGFIVDMSILYLGIKGYNTYPIGNVFFFFQSIIFLLIFKRLLNLSNIVWYLVAGYSLFFLINYLYIQGPSILNSNSHTVSAVIMIFLSLMYFRHLLIELPEEYIHKLPMIWVNLSVLVYYSGNIFLFIVNNYLTDGIEGNQRLMWVIHNSLNSMKNFLFTIAIWQSLRKTSSSSC